MEKKSYYITSVFELDDFLLSTLNVNNDYYLFIDINKLSKNLELIFLLYKNTPALRSKIIEKIKTYDINHPLDTYDLLKLFEIKYKSLNKNIINK